MKKWHQYRKCSAWFWISGMESQGSCENANYKTSSLGNTTL